MVLSYDKYIALMSALDEHCKGTLERNKLQDAIFDHYMSIEKSFVAENINGTKILFTVNGRVPNKCYKNRRKVFRNFMNTELTKKRKWKKKK